MKRDIYNINLKIPNIGIFIMDLDDEKLTIFLDLTKFECNNTLAKKLDSVELAKLLHPYIIYEVLEENNKNNFNGVKIIGKIEKNIDKEIKKLETMKAFISPCFFLIK